MKQKRKYNWNEWVRKAEIDKRAAQRALRDCLRDPEQAEIVCFHAQQCSEKYLKAVLAIRGRRPPKIHDLAKLIVEIKTEGVDLTHLVEESYILNDYAIDTRYPGSSASPAEARLALLKMNKIVSACRIILKKFR